MYPKDRHSVLEQAQLGAQDLMLGSGFSNFLLSLLILAVLEASHDIGSKTLGLISQFIRQSTHSSVRPIQQRLLEFLTGGLMPVSLHIHFGYFPDE